MSERPPRADPAVPPQLTPAGGPAADLAVEPGEAPPLDTAPTPPGTAPNLLDSLPPGPIPPAAAFSAAQAEPCLAVRDLAVSFRTRGGTVKALEQVGFTVGRGEIVALVGESGSGKSVTAYALMGILDAAGEVTAGTAQFGGTDLLHAPERTLRGIRGRDISMIFQNPRTALNPIRPVGKQIADVLIRHGGAGRREAPAAAIEMLRRVRITDPERRARAYPYEMSGGMCQRVMIAIALACRPKLLIADEPTTGIDVTTQAVIMDLLTGLARESGVSALVITHDLALASEYCDRVVVMHAGHVVEDAPVRDLFAHPRHPYTARLLAATPTGHASLADLASIPGSLPDLRRPDLPACRYIGRCDRALDSCQVSLQRREIAPSHLVACNNPL
ncbi:ABC transporter ATP-binding protein [Roseomonas sp. NAR14]|uniref:ABC transporter ATP-binding protein n=1 Tax=Roseomonas acroporae TaxID=2937791 RepID=A0A9X2BTT8_9PROT|nr:ABC transporter ATP-binding protein [Roseomonas acroporae]MCK8783491.1 ABC transporter ATP-binding protein [Roseomonas acroporae]